MSDSWFEQSECAGCGEFFSPPEDRGYWFSDQTFLCWDCAVRRGGVYDAVTERWINAPDVSGLVDERRPHP